MPVQPPTPDHLRELVGSRHPLASFEYPPAGMQPYYDWLLGTIHLLADASCGHLRVARDDASETHVAVAPGRATVDDVVLDVPGQTLDLVVHNNDTALVYLEDDAGPAVIAAASASGYPARPHLKLAEVTLAGGVITGILDRRFETILKA